MTTAAARLALRETGGLARRAEALRSTFTVTRFRLSPFFGRAT